MFILFYSQLLARCSMLRICVTHAIFFCANGMVDARCRTLENKPFPSLFPVVLTNNEFPRKK